MEMKDIPEVVEIDRSSFTLPWTERSYKYEAQENSAARCWVTMVDGRVASLLVLWLIVDEAHIATIATHPQFRRRGFAKRMLIQSLVSAREEGALKSLLEVRARHVVAQKIYCDIGFVEVGRRPMYYRDNGEDAVLMTMEDLDGLKYAEGK
ncbi:MAG: ribosomal-protein-alanine N-acetyltransferase [Chloroflexi bacterium RIFOXYD12_FULL_57_15]|nr:MAG: ribosomal-protein-alanine N-acetyltransferase [Chloroflexi bacterium RIFOXYD12_FULL_57_15]